MYFICVGFYSQNSSPTNTFQVVLRDRSSDFDPGDFDIEFRYADLNWTTGDASGGENGLGGSPAQAGFDAGDEENFLTLPGSRTEEILNLVNLSNTEEPGLFSYAIRNGELPGGSPDNPLLPVNTDDGFEFDFNIADTEERIFIDPEVATGYNYFVNSGSNISSVQISTDAGDGVYDLFLPNGTGGFVDSGTDISTNDIFDFTSLFSEGVNAFSIRGIEVDAGLDPEDPLAFVTGLTFVDTGFVNMSQNPIVENTDDPTTPVPESNSIISILALGTIGLSTLLRNQKKESV